MLTRKVSFKETLSFGKKGGGRGGRYCKEKGVTHMKNILKEGKVLSPEGHS